MINKAMTDDELDQRVRASVLAERVDISRLERRGPQVRSGKRAAFGSGPLPLRPASRWLIAGLSAANSAALRRRCPRSSSAKS